MIAAFNKDLGMIGAELLDQAYATAASAAEEQDTISMQKGCSTSSCRGYLAAGNSRFGCTSLVKMLRSIVVILVSLGY